MSEEILYIDDGELVYYINENEFITCDEIPMPMLEGIKHLQQKVEQLESIRKEAIEFINEWLFEAGENGADMDYDTIVDLLNILNKGDNNERK